MSIYMIDVNDRWLSKDIAAIRMLEINGHPDIHSDVTLIVL